MSAPDLRIGLVEATRRAIDDWPTDADGNLDVGAVVDVQLGFLTDNAEVPVATSDQFENLSLANFVALSGLSGLIAVLRDRDRP